MRKVIVNSTPLIALSHVKQLGLLRDLYGQVTIPRAVYDEIWVKTDSSCKKAVDNALDWIVVEDIKTRWPETEMSKLKCF